jgi:hypothetical protein
MKVWAVLGSVGIACLLILSGCGSSSGPAENQVSASDPQNSTTSSSSSTSSLVPDCAGSISQLVAVSANDPKAVQDASARKVLTSCTQAQFVDEFPKQASTAPLGSVGAQIATSIESLKRLNAELPIAEGKDSVLGTLCSGFYVSDANERAKFTACNGFW